MMSKKVVDTIPFQHFSNRLGSRVSNPGKRLQDVFSDSFDTNGVATVVVSGQRDIQEYINSFRDQCDIYKILGDLSIANGELPSVDPSSFLDTTIFPENYHDLHKIMNDAQAAFDRLPSDVRLKYSNNYREFIADFGSDNFFSVLGSLVPSDSVDVNVKGDVSDE